MNDTPENIDAIYRKLLMKLLRKQNSSALEQATWHSWHLDFQGMIQESFFQNISTKEYLRKIRLQHLTGMVSGNW